MIDENTVIQARNTDLITFLEQRNNFTFKSRGYEYRCREHPSLAVKGDRLSWFWHGGYGALDYLINIDGYGFRQAVEQLNCVSFSPSVQVEEKEQTPKTLILPEKAFLYKRLFAYLCKTRGIDHHIITTLIQEKKLYEDTKGNVVFIGSDEQNEPKYACLRGTYTNNPFRMECTGSDTQYGFHMTYADNGRLFIFEAPIDALSHATLENLITGDKTAWRKDNRLSLGGVSSVALDKYLELHPLIKELIFCLDSDAAGRDAAVDMARRYADKGYITRLELPTHKDYNEDLLAYIAKYNEKRSKAHDR